MESTIPAALRTKRKRVHPKWWGTKPRKKRCPRCNAYNLSGYVCHCENKSIDYKALDARRKRNNRRGFHETRVLTVNRRLQREGLPFKLAAERRLKYGTGYEPVVNLVNTATGAIVVPHVDVWYWAGEGTKVRKEESSPRKHPYEVWIEKKQRRERGEPEPVKPVPVLIQWLIDGAQGEPPLRPDAQ